MSNTTNKEKTAEEVLAKYHWTIDEDIIKAMHEFSALQLSAHCKEKEEWVSVSERLPKDNEEVLCFGKYGMDVITHDYANLVLEYTHWQPLPSPPKH